MRRYVAMLGTTTLAALVALPAAAALYKADRIESLSVNGADFNSQLALQYRDLAIYERSEMADWIDAENYAGKAHDAADGADVRPWNPDHWYWSIDSEAALAELRTARQKLLAALDRGGRTAAPTEAARAQASYDCWLEQQDEGWQMAHIAACKRQFEEAMAAMNAAMAPRPVAAPAPEPADLSRLRTTVYFDLDDDQVKPEERGKIDAFVNQLPAEPNYMIAVIGHADTSGSADYNAGLSARRAEAVQEELIGLGIRTATDPELALAAKGESDPAVATGDGVREAMNRRVDLRAVPLLATGQRH